MSLRRISNIPGAGVVPTTNGIEGGDDDPKKPKKQPTTFDLVVSNSVWLLRTANGIIVYSLGYFRRMLQESAAMIMNSVGFLCSAGLEILLTSRSDFKHQWLPLVEDLKLFLQKSGIGDELTRGLSSGSRFLSSIAILARMEDDLLVKKGATGEAPRLDRRRLALPTEGTDQAISEEKRNYIINEGTRFMNYATAAYGISFIDAAEIHVHGEIQTSRRLPSTSAVATATKLLSSMKSSVKTSKRKVQLHRSASFFDEDFVRTRIGEHIGIPEKDVYMMNLWDDLVDALRYFIAVDHENKAVVLSIRGSFTVKDLLIDIAAFSRPFCGGEAHSEMAHSTEKLWDETKDTIGNLLGNNPGYEFVITGHSLGAGCATLLNILLHENNREKVNGRAIRCFAFASPPCFFGTVDKQASEACINYIHDSDIVPFLSVDSVRRMFAALHVIEESNLSAWLRILIISGSIEVIKPAMRESVERALHEPPPAKEGAPELVIPAHTNVWMRSKELVIPRDLDIDNLPEEFDHNAPSDFVLVDSSKLVEMGISLDPLMITNHFPNGYESCLQNLS